MKSVLSEHPSLLNIGKITSIKEGPSNLNVVPNSIIIPKPIRPIEFDWLNYISSFCDSRSLIDLNIKSKNCLITEEARRLKVQKFLEKRRKRERTKKVRYQYRQQAAYKKMRYRGRFINATEAKKLISKGEQVTSNDNSELNKLFEEMKKENLIECNKLIKGVSSEKSMNCKNKENEYIKHSSPNTDINMSIIMNPLIQITKTKNLNYNDNGKYSNSIQCSYNVH